MDKFEELGRRLDEELARLRRYLEEEVAPETEKRSAQFLREVSEKLAEASSRPASQRAARKTRSSRNRDVGPIPCSCRSSGFLCFERGLCRQATNGKSPSAPSGVPACRGRGHSRAVQKRRDSIARARQACQSATGTGSCWL